MCLFIITTEDIADGTWFEDPAGFDNEADARKSATSMKRPPEGYRHVLYRCNEVAELSVHEARK